MRNWRNLQDEIVKHVEKHVEKPLEKPLEKHVETPLDTNNSDYSYHIYPKKSLVENIFDSIPALLVLTIYVTVFIKFCS